MGRSLFVGCAGNNEAVLLCLWGLIAWEMEFRLLTRIRQGHSRLQIYLPLGVKRGHILTKYDGQSGTIPSTDVLPMIKAVQTDFIR